MTKLTFSCQCATNWYGIRCTESHDDCTGASSSELCGHGTCVNVPRTQPGQVNYVSHIYSLCYGQSYYFLF